MDLGGIIRPSAIGAFKMGDKIHAPKSTRRRKPSQGQREAQKSLKILSDVGGLRPFIQKSDTEPTELNSAKKMQVCSGTILQRKPLIGVQAAMGLFVGSNCR
jgi:hypothetical protein